MRYPVVGRLLKPDETPMEYISENEADDKKDK